MIVTLSNSNRNREGTFFFALFYVFLLFIILIIAGCSDFHWVLIQCT